MVTSLLSFLLILILIPQPTFPIRIGIGSFDATGPTADVCLMGYANPAQIAGGIHLRLRARAFLFAEEQEEDGPTIDQSHNKFVFVSGDFGMGSQKLTREVLTRLAARFPGQYGWHNVFISGTHTHSAPGGFSQYVLPSVPSLGFVPETFHAYATAVTETITRAHQSAEPMRKLRFGKGPALPHSNINRSPSAYRNNPPGEIAQYENEGNTEKHFTMLAIDDFNSQLLGVLNFFSVHGTSLPNTNTLVSGDNKGVASALMEQWYNPKNTLPGQGRFVAAFAATNLGDVSPNVNGTFCKTSGLPCEELHSTCRGLNEFCHGRGPHSDSFQSTFVLGMRQAQAAKMLLESGTMKTAPMDSRVRSIERIVDLSNVTVDLSRVGQQMFPDPAIRPSSYHGIGKTCSSALGYGFAAGTTDGPGMFDFYQGEKRDNPFWELVRDAITATPSKESTQCQYPKPILLPTGQATFPGPWEPAVVSLGIAHVGTKFALLSAPVEFTTMAGRRLTRVIKRVLVDHGVLDEDAIVSIAGLCNGYTHYAATFEEYQIQRYEGASTLYGPHTLAAYVQEFTIAAQDLAAGVRDRSTRQATTRASQVPNLNLGGFLSPPVPDRTIAGHKFGDVLMDAKPFYRIKVDSSDTTIMMPRFDSEADLQMNDDGVLVVVEFQSSNPRHDPRIGDTFLTVEKKMSDGSFRVVATDSSFDTKFIYRRDSHGVSVARIEWYIRQGRVQEGRYRIGHWGSWMTEKKELEPFFGYSREFGVGEGMPSWWFDVGLSWKREMVMVVVVVGLGRLMWWWMMTEKQNRGDGVVKVVVAAEEDDNI